MTDDFSFRHNGNSPLTIYSAAGWLGGRFCPVLMLKFNAFILAMLMPIIAVNAKGSELVRDLEAEKPQTVVFYGTSVTSLWPQLVAQRLDERYFGLLKPVFSSMPGKNSQDGVVNLQRMVLDHKPDVVFLEFAINDAVLRFKITPQESRDNLLKMIDALRAQNPEVEIILSTMNDVIDIDDKTPATNRPHLADYYQVYRDVAVERKCDLIDHYTHWLELRKKDEAKFKSYLPDGLHPNATAAREFIVPTVMEFLLKGVKGVALDHEWGLRDKLAGLSQIATRTLAAQRPQPKTSGHDACTTCIAHVVTADATGLRFVYGAPAGIPYELKASVDIRGTIYPLAFEDKSTVNVRGRWCVVSDPVDVSVSRGETIHSRTYTVDSTGKDVGAWQAVIRLSADRGEWHGEGDLTAAAQVQGFTYNDNTRGPLHIMGRTKGKAKAVAFNGDSIVSVIESPWTVRLADKAGIAWSSGTTGGDSILYQQQRRVACWPVGLGGFTHFICALGANDVGRGDAILQRYVEQWTWAKKQGVKVYQTTVLPIASSTDRFATLEGQTPRENEAFRVRVNDWLRDGAPLLNGVPAIGTKDPAAVRIDQPGHPLDGYIETADAVESSRNSGKWRIDHGPIGGDGLHPNARAHELIAQSISAKLFD